jgi:hypothetical protein
MIRSSRNRAEAPAAPRPSPDAATSGFMLPLQLLATAMGLHVRAAHIALLLRNTRDEFCGVDRVDMAIIAAGIASGWR